MVPSRPDARIAWATDGQLPTRVRAAPWMTHVEHDLASPIGRPWPERLGRGATLIRPFDLTRYFSTDVIDKATALGSGGNRFLAVNGDELFVSVGVQGGSPGGGEHR